MQVNQRHIHCGSYFLNNAGIVSMLIYKFSGFIKLTTHYRGY